MDWPKIKSIFIVLLLVVDCILGGYYFYDKKTEQDSLDQSIKNVIEFVGEEGIDVKCEIPTERPELYLLSVTLTEGNADNLYYMDGEFKVDIVGRDGLSAVIESEGGSKKQVDTASKSIIKFYQSLSKDEKSRGCTIDHIELVYLIELDDTAQTGQKDTASPAWKIVTSLGIYYFNAYTE